MAMKRYQIEVEEYEVKRYYISKNFAGSDVPWVTERKVFCGYGEY